MTLRSTRPRFTGHGPFLVLFVFMFGGCSGPTPAAPLRPGSLAQDRAPVPDTARGLALEKCGVVLRRGPAGAWDAGMVESPSVWYDPARRRYGMVYAGYGLRPGMTSRQGYAAVSAPQVGLAWSDDLMRWEKAGPAPLFSPSGVPGTPDAAGIAGPVLWHEDGTYYLFYIGLTETGYEKGQKTLNVATSTDLRTWTRHAGNPIIAPAGEGWRRDAIWHPGIVKVSGTYYLFFNASGLVDGHEEEYIGYATSTDLLNWTVDDAASPLLVGSGRPGAWDATRRAGDPSLFHAGGLWWMAYYSWNRAHAYDGLAWTTEAAFPLGWRPIAANPVLDVGAPGSFDALYAHKPYIFRTETRHHHYYTAVDTMQTREIALAVAPGPCR
jgi:predicted GH43/DUF377 family glycosyl hydrolase